MPGNNEKQQPTKKDFLISYTEADADWAKWIAWHLVKQGYQIILPEWDFRAGSNKIYELHRATIEAERIIAIFSQRYIASLYMHPEWASAFQQDTPDEEKRLLPICVEPYEIAGFLKHIVPIDLIGLDDAAASAKLAQAITGERRTGMTPPRFPGTPAVIVGLDHGRNHLFVGREHVLKAIHKTLQAGMVTAITPTVDINNGTSIGKTTIAIEYVYRYKSHYSHILWVQDSPDAPASHLPPIQSLASIASGLGISNWQEEDQEGIILLLKEWLTTHTDWLLVFDGKANHRTITEFLTLPQKGTILITTRDRSVASIAHLIEITGLTQEENRYLLKLDQLMNAALHGQNKEQLHLGPGKTTIGNALDNIIVTKDPSVSDHHAVILPQDGYYIITDLESKNGTFVNQKRIKPLSPYFLKPKDKIRLGNMWLAFAADTTSLHISSDAQKLFLRENEQKYNEVLPDNYSLPYLDEPQIVLQQVQQGNYSEEWKIFRSEDVSFQDVTLLFNNLHLSGGRALLVWGAFTTSCISLLIVFAANGRENAGFLILLILLGCLFVIVSFAVNMVNTIQNTPGISRATPYPNALLILTLEGFIEYIDTQYVIDSVSFGELTSIQRYVYDDGAAFLKLFYIDGREGEWDPRAHFGPPALITQKILDNFIQYANRYR